MAKLTALKHIKSRPSHLGGPYVYFPAPGKGEVVAYEWPYCDLCGAFRSRHLRKLHGGYWADTIGGTWVSWDEWRCHGCDGEGKLDNG